MKKVKKAKKVINEKRIRKLTEVDIDVPIYQKVIKLGEESGEVAQAFLELDGAKNVSASASTEDKIMEVIEECGDTINVALDIIFALQTHNHINSEYIRKLFDSKLDKWERKQNNY